MNTYSARLCNPLFNRLNFHRILYPVALLALAVGLPGQTVVGGVVGPVILGGNGYTAVTGDYDGDGKSDPTVYQESMGLWYSASSSNHYYTSVLSLGGPGWLPVPADYDGDGKADPAVYNTGSYVWLGRLSASNYQMAQQQFGAAGYLPVPGDYDGDGRADLTVYQTSSGEWYSQPSDDPGLVSVGTVAQFRAVLEQGGYTVRQGLLTNINVIALFQAGVVPSCYGNNNDSPYLAPILPIPPEQTVSNTMPFTFRLRSDEAVVWIGTTPPETIYFSVQPFLAQRTVESINQRLRLFNNVGDTLNNFVLHTTGTPNGNTGNVYTQETVIIFTADRGVEAQMRAAAIAAGYSSNILNTIVLPDSILNLGLAAADDEIQMLMRMAFPADTNALNAYVAAPPISVFRVTPVTAPGPDLFPMPVLRVRGTGITEMDYNAALDALRSAILAAYPGYASTQLITTVAVPPSLSASQEIVDTMAETRDTVYLMTEEFSLTNNEFVVVFGVNHVLSGKATYTSANVYGTTPVADSPGNREMVGVASINSVQHFPGTAADYIPGHAQVTNLWAYKIAWSNPSGDPHCLVIPPPTGRIKLQVLQLAFRAYIEPGRAVGTAPEELLFDRAILFRPAP